MRRRLRILLAALLWSTALVPVAHADPVTTVISAVGSLFTGVSSFLGGAGIVAGIARLGIGIAAQYAMAKWGQAKQKSQASQLETTYGEDGARQIILGTVGTAGQHAYRNAFNKGNRRIQDVYRLSDFRITKILRVMYEGKWVTSDGAETDAQGFRIPGIGTGPGGAELWIKTYPGTLDQQADPALIAKANPAGRWTTDHRGAGIAYAIATYQIEKEDITQPWQAFFEVMGAPLYDWRKDTTMGGDGLHRWNDQSTWEYTDNPVIMMYNLERGIYAGSELMVGKGTPAARLNSKISEWTVAANICDETMDDGSKRYVCALIAKSGDGATHDSNMQPLLESCAGSWVEDAEGQYPLVGANQAVVSVFTDDDICWEESFRFARKRTRSELVNTVAGTFIDPESFYQSVPFATRTDADARAVDGERLARSFAFSSITDSRVADRLADIAFRASRYQGNGSIVLRPKFLETARVGRWMRWDSERYSGSYTLQVLTRQLGPLGESGARNVHITFQEVGNGVFDPTQFETVPVITPGVGAPDYLSEVQNLALSELVVSVNGKKFPAIRTQRDPIEDVTVTGVEFRYFPTLQPDVIMHKAEAVDVDVVPLTEGIVSSTEYGVDTRLITQPYRTVPWSATRYITTPAQPHTDVLAELAQLAEDAKSIISEASQLQTVYRDLIERVATDAMIGTGMNVVDRQVYTEQLRNAFAQIVEEKRLRADGDEAVAQIVTQITAQVDDAKAQLTEEKTVRATADTALSQANQALTSRLDSPTTGLQALSTALQSAQTKVTEHDGELDALATLIAGVETQVGDVSAGGLISFKAQIPPPSGVLAQIHIMARATTSGTFIQSGFVIEIYQDGSTTRSRILALADRFMIWDGTAKNLPFVYENGIMKVANVVLGTLKFDRLLSNNGKLELRGDGNNAYIRITT